MGGRPFISSIFITIFLALNFPFDALHLRLVKSSRRHFALIAVAGGPKQCRTKKLNKNHSKNERNEPEKTVATGHTGSPALCLPGSNRRASRTHRPQTSGRDLLRARGRILIVCYRRVRRTAAQSRDAAPQINRRNAAAGDSASNSVRATLQFNSLQLNSIRFNGKSSCTMATPAKLDALRKHYGATRREPSMERQMTWTNLAKCYLRKPLYYYYL